MGVKFKKNRCRKTNGNISIKYNYTITNQNHAEPHEWRDPRNILKKIK